MYSGFEVPGPGSAYSLKVPVVGKKRKILPVLNSAPQTAV
jgi:hypothetical protein